MLFESSAANLVVCEVHENAICAASSENNGKTKGHLQMPLVCLFLQEFLCIVVFVF